MKSLFLIPLSLVASASVLAMPIAERPFDPSSAAPAAVAAYDFEGILAMSGCSASLVRFTSSKDDDMAMALTNGHCTGGMFGGLIDPGEHYFHKRVSDRMDVLNPKTGSSLGKVKATQILYATMTGTDMALYELKSSYRDILAKFKVRPFTLVETAADAGAKIDIVSGYWKKGYSCSIQKIVYELREADWTMHDSMLYSQPGCETIHGTSGSPIIQSGTRNIIGVNNTGNDRGEKCTMDNPCEVDRNGNIEYQKGRSYGQQIAGIYSCLNAQGAIDLTVPTCSLTK